MNRQPGQLPPRHPDPTRLLITDIPRFQLRELDAALSNFIYWHTHFCVTREDRVCRDESYVRLRQAHWHVRSALDSLNPAPMDSLPWWRRGLLGKKQDKAA